MVIDDDQSILELFEILLTDDGYHVILSRHIDEDAASVERAGPDLIILDILFEGEAQGIRMLEALKRHQATSRIPIIVCTAASGAAIEALEAHLTDPRVRLILKPFQIDDVSSAVSQLLAVRLPAPRGTFRPTSALTLPRRH
jgi:DNA-binding NtrC family response regulator